jgi:parallel beta-helix repeat protein
MGGGISCSSSSPSIRNNTLTGNSAGSGGGGIACYADSSPIIQNNILSGNSAAWGGGIDCDFDSSPTIQNDTLIGNSAGDGDGGGICCFDSSTTIANCIVAFSSAGGGLLVVNSAPTVTYSDFYGNVGGNYIYVNLPPSDPTGTDGNISSDPLFADTAHGDLHEKSRGGRWNPKQNQWVVDAIQSACIDAGDPASDYSQEPRPNGTSASPRASAIGWRSLGTARSSRRVLQQRCYVPSTCGARSTSRPTW